MSLISSTNAMRICFANGVADYAHAGESFDTCGLSFDAAVPLSRAMLSKVIQHKSASLYGINDFQKQHCPVHGSGWYDHSSRRIRERAGTCTVGPCVLAAHGSSHPGMRAHW